MNEELQFNHMESYELAEQKAAHYFNTLSAQVLQKSFIPTLTKDFNSWKQHHILIIHSCQFFHEKRKNLIQRDITVIFNGWIIRAN